MKIGVVGLGYVGLTAAVGLASFGHKVIGYDHNKNVVKQINRFQVQYPGDDELFDQMRRTITFNSLQVQSKMSEDLWHNLDAVLVCVGVNVSKGGIPDYDNLLDALDAVSNVLIQGALIIIETTLPAGTMDRIIVPLLGCDYMLAYCPERVTPGKLLFNFYNMPRVVGVDSTSTFNAVSTVYCKDLTLTWVGTEIYPDLLEATYIDAELTKLGENAYRDIQLAFVNSMALTAEQYGGDVWKVRELINTIGDRYVLSPGPGVGGYCLQKDTRLLAHGNLNANLFNAAYHLNNWMPTFIAGLVAQYRIRKVLLLGVAYKADVADARNSPAYDIGMVLQMFGATIVYHDPFIDKHNGEIYNKARECGAVILVTDHAVYRHIDYDKLFESTQHTKPLFIDTRNATDAEQFQNWEYHCLGVGGNYGREQ